MNTSWGRSIFSVFLILSLNDAHGFCQNVMPSSPSRLQSSLLNSKINGECKTNVILPNPQLMTTLQSIGSNNVLPEIPTSGPALSLPKNQKLPFQDGFTQKPTMLPSTITTYPRNPPAALSPSGLLDRNLILPSPKLPLSLPTSTSAPPLPKASPTSISFGQIPQAHLSSSLLDSVPSNIIRPITRQKSINQVNLSTETTLAEADTVLKFTTPSTGNTISSNPVQTTLPILQTRQNLLNPIVSNNYPLSTTSIQTGVNQINQLLTKPTIQNQFGSVARGPEYINQVMSTTAAFAGSGVSDGTVISNPAGMISNLDGSSSRFLQQRNSAQPQFLSQLTPTNNPVNQENILLAKRPFSQSTSLVSELNQVNSLPTNQQLINKSSSNNLPIQPAFLSDVNQFNLLSNNQQFINQFPSNNFIATQSNVPSEINQVNPLLQNQKSFIPFPSNNIQDIQTMLPELIQFQPNQQFISHISPNYPATQLNILPLNNPLNQFQTPFPGSQSYLGPQSQLLTTAPNNIITSESLQTEVNTQQSTTLQEQPMNLQVIAPTLAIDTNVEITNAANSALVETSQAVLTDESTNELPINLIVNIPPSNMLPRSVTLMTPPASTVSSPSAPVVPSFASYPPIQPIILEGSNSKSKLKQLLPIILISLLDNDRANYRGCSCCK